MMKSPILCGLLWLFSNCACTLPEVNMNVTEVIHYYGYPFEVHEVTTKDGYILTLHRIPRGIKHTKTPRPVVLLQHGLLDTAFTWIANGPQKSLGFILADSGFDVWLSNSRGNTYSRRHVRLSNTSPEFWDFTFDEMAEYDLPAVITKALSVSKASKLSYVGHSQGTEIGFAQFSKRTAINSKVSAFVALTPLAYLGNLKVAIRVLVNYAIGLNSILKASKTGEFLPKELLLPFLHQPLCLTKTSPNVCRTLGVLVDDFSITNLNSSRFPVYLSHIPAGTSTKNIYHYGQSYMVNRFQYYDYGQKENLKRFNQTNPPLYRLNTDGLPIAMFYGGKDWLTVPDDVEHTMKDLGDNIKFKKHIPHYNHFDFLWATTADKLVFPDVISFLNKYNRQ